MALPSDYANQACSMARTLEVIGERWTLLIVRDAFFGVRRFGDFATHLRIPRAVLAERLKALTGAGVFARVAGEGQRDEYELTEKGQSLWPVIRSLMVWGDENYAPGGPCRIFLHAVDDGDLDPTGRCQRCGSVVEARETDIVPGPGVAPPRIEDDLVTIALAGRHRLLQPVRHSDHVLIHLAQVPDA